MPTNMIIFVEIVECDQVRSVTVYQGIETETILPWTGEVGDGNIAKIINYSTET